MKQLAALAFALVALTAAPAAHATPLTITNEQEAGERRAQVIRHVFGANGLPARLPVVRRNFEAPRFRDMANLARVDQLHVNMGGGWTSNAYHLVPQRRNGQALVWHQGHEEPVFRAIPFVQGFLAEGFSVFVLSMPLAHGNGFPRLVCGVDPARPENPYRLHDDMHCLPNGLRYFIEPVSVTLNWADRWRFRRVSMAGLSGGGWTTVVAAAVDDRIQRSYPIAGSAPLSDCPDWEAEPRCARDHEQTEIVKAAGYLDLYALGAWGRRQVVINNVYDACCFFGRGHEVWGPAVAETAGRLGGSFVALGDETHAGHTFSPWARDVVIRDLR